MTIVEPEDLLSQRSIEGRDRHNPKGPSRYAQAKTKQVDE